MINRILFLLLITLTSCGYQPLYSKKETKTLIVNELELIGDANINKSIIMNDFTTNISLHII